MPKQYTATLDSCHDCPFYHFMSIDCVAHVRCSHLNGPAEMPGNGKESIYVSGEFPPNCPLPEFAPEGAS